MAQSRDAEAELDAASCLSEVKIAAGRLMRAREALAWLEQAANSGTVNLMVNLNDANGSVNDPVYTLGQAARATGKSKAAIHKAVKTGRISASRTPDGHYQIDPSELHRVYPRVFTSEPGETVARPEVVDGGFTLLPPSSSTRQADRPPEREVELLREMLEASEAHVRDLQRRLDAEAEERRALTQRLLGPPEGPAAPARSWWQRWRGGSR